MPLPAHLTLEILTPERSLAHADVDEVQIPGADGYFGVLPGHTPLLALLQVGQLWYRRGADKQYLSVAFGFAEVLPDRVTILARIAERAEDINLARAEDQKRRAQDRLSQRGSEDDLNRARISMLKALVRLQVAGRSRTRG